MYKPCPNCGYELCIMDRRDFDECTMCGHPLPDELKVEDWYKEE